jgi:hypothetical protein
MSDAKTLVDAQLAVMADVPYLQKRTSNELKYTFASEADLIRAVRGAMIDHGLTITPIGAEPVYDGSQVAKSGREMPHIRLRLTYRFSHVSGESVDVETIGEALDPSDKAANKAMTIGMKYALRQFFLIETGDDPDAVAHNRDAENADWVSIAIKKIDACRTIDELSRQSERFRGKDPNTGKDKFTEDQLAELDAYATKHLAKIAKGQEPR